MSKIIQGGWRERGATPRVARSSPGARAIRGFAPRARPASNYFADFRSKERLLAVYLAILVKDS